MVAASSQLARFFLAARRHQPKMGVLQIHGAYPGRAGLVGKALQFVIAKKSASTCRRE